MLLLRSQSFDSYDNTNKIQSMENEISILKRKQLLYQKDTNLFKHLVNDIQKLKTKYNNDIN